MPRLVVPPVALALAAFLLASLPSPSAAQVDPGELTGLVVDDADAKFVGSWVSSTHTAGYLGRGYSHDEAAGKGEKSATFEIEIEQAGPYQVLVSYTAGGNRAPKVPVHVGTAGGVETVHVDQTKRPLLGTGFQPLGEFAFEVGVTTIVLDTKGTTQHVIADGVRLLTPEQFEVAKAKEKDTPPPKVAKKEEAPPRKRPEFEKPPIDPDAERLTAARLDELLGEALGESTTPIVDDAWFLRRASLDVIGRQPTLEELRTFLADDTPDKRARAVDRLLFSPEYGHNWANYWSDTISNRTPEPQLTFLDYSAFKEWLADELNAGTTWDEIAFRMMTPVGKVADDPAGSFIGFHQGEPNRLAGETTRVFLSVKIACAQCHDHPFVDMPQEVFHGMAAFFVRTKVKVPQNNSLQIDIGSDEKKEHRMPGSKESMQPTVLGGDSHELGLSDLERRTRLGYWLVDADNAHFARTYVNRVWARMMGRGFYDPVDDMGEGTEPLLPEVLDALAEHFVATGFDTRSVVRVIARSRAYQRHLIAGEESEDETLAAFGSARTKMLRGDEIFDSLEAAIDLPNHRPPMPPKTKAVRFPIPPKSTRDLVNVAFGYDPSFPDSWLTRTMAQAMFLMNNDQVQARIDADPESGTMLAELVASERDDAKVVDTLFERVLARQPASGEREIALAHVESVGDRGEAFEDLLWSLLNTAEFTTRK